MILTLSLGYYFNDYHPTYLHQDHHLLEEKEVIKKMDTTPVDTPLRVMTYNIRYGKGEDGIQDLRRIAEIIHKAGVEIVGLQEVETFSPRSQYVNQARWLAEELGMYAIYSPALSVGPYHYGNAILSRYPITYYSNQPLQSSREPRNYIKARIDVNGEEILFITTHLGLSQGERLDHIQQLLKSIKEHSLPVVLVGDLNCTPEAKEIKQIRGLMNDSHQKSGFDKGLTFPSQEPRYRIDYIFATPDIQLLKSKGINSMVSDHLPVIAEMIIPKRIDN